MNNKVIGIIDNLNNERVATLKQIDVNDKVREIVNKWIKKQATYQGLMGCGNNGYIVTESQMKKLKKELWRNINYQVSGKQEQSKKGYGRSYGYPKNLKEGERVKCNCGGIKGEDWSHETWCEEEGERVK